MLEGSKEAVNTRGRTAKCRAQQPARRASNPRAVRVTVGPLPQLLSCEPWRLQHAQGSVRTDWDDPAQETPPTVHTGTRNRTRTTRKMEWKRRTQRGRGQRQREGSVQGRRPAVCLTKKLHRQGG